MADFAFKPSADVAFILNQLLDIYERRDGDPKQAVRLKVADQRNNLPGYYDQTTPTPRVTAHDQLNQLAAAGLLRLDWEFGQPNHLLEMVTLTLPEVAPLYNLLKREPLAEQRQRLRAQLLGYRPHLDGWQAQAINHILSQIKAHKSPSPFSLTDLAWNDDLLTVLEALPKAAIQQQGIRTEVPYRVFSVRVFNDSKRFEGLKEKVARLAQRHNRQWRALTTQETLREMGLVANPSHLYLSGQWRLVDQHGQQTALAGFQPAVGIPAALAATVQRVRIEAPALICIENLASFYSFIQHQAAQPDTPNWAVLCLWGNPSPACRHLLACLVETVSADLPLYIWADIDYGGLNILAQLRQQVSRRFQPYLMNAETLDAHERWAHPLTPSDEKNLARLKQVPALADMTGLIDHMLLREIKLEQEAILF